MTALPSPGPLDLDSDVDRILGVDAGDRGGRRPSLASATERCPRCGSDTCPGRAETALCTAEIDGRRASDTGYAPDRWAFDGEVTRVFDDMLARSIPDYAAMRELVTDLAVAFAQKDTHVVDLGTSRGEALAAVYERLGARNRYVGIEVSAPMLAAARERFAGRDLVRIESIDLRTDYPKPAASVVLSVLTLMFVPIEHRLRVLRRAYESLVDGGALILVEKVLGSSARLDEAFVDRYWRMKREHGYTDDDVRRKALALEGVLVPITARWNEEALASAGFREVDCFWRVGNFAGWVAVK